MAERMSEDERRLRVLFKHEPLPTCPGCGSNRCFCPCDRVFKELLATLDAARAERDEARARNEQVVCSYCSTVFQRGPTVDATAKTLIEHFEVCESHPARLALACDRRVEEAEARAEAAEKERDAAREFLKKPLGENELDALGEIPDKIIVSGTASPIGGIFILPASLRRMVTMVRSAREDAERLAGALREIAGLRHASGCVTPQNPNPPYIPLTTTVCACWVGIAKTALRAHEALGKEGGGK